MKTVTRCDRARYVTFLNNFYKENKTVHLNTEKIDETSIITNWKVILRDQIPYSTISKRTNVQDIGDTIAKMVVGWIYRQAR